MARRKQPCGTIGDEADISAGVRALTRVCPHMKAAVALSGHPPLRRWSPAFDGLARIVVGQQLSIASAAAILGRLTQAVAPLDALNLLAATDETLRAAGLSSGKIATLRAVATAVVSGALDFDHIQRADAATVREHLTAIRGIGPWTADIYLLFCRGDADAFAPGDLALQIAAQQLMDLPARPTADQLTTLAERWRPWRGIAARLLWAHYGALKAKKG
jgi:DNA-3-methyladenine glycosylase II